MEAYGCVRNGSTNATVGEEGAGQERRQPEGRGWNDSSNRAEVELSGGVQVGSGLVGLYNTPTRTP
jgi:hypothetical protein